jgi:hypothetical protein
MPSSYCFSITSKNSPSRRFDEFPENAPGLERPMERETMVWRRRAQNICAVDGAGSLRFSYGLLHFLLLTLFEKLPILQAFLGIAPLMILQIQPRNT